MIQNVTNKPTVVPPQYPLKCCDEDKMAKDLRDVYNDHAAKVSNVLCNFVSNYVTIYM